MTKFKGVDEESKPQLVSDGQAGTAGL